MHISDLEGNSSLSMHFKAKVYDNLNIYISSSQNEVEPLNDALDDLFSVLYTASKPAITCFVCSSFALAANIQTLIKDAPLTGRFSPSSGCPRLLAAGVQRYARGATLLPQANEWPPRAFWQSQIRVSCFDWPGSAFLDATQVSGPKTHNVQTVA